MKEKSGAVCCTLGGVWAECAKVLEGSKREDPEPWGGSTSRQ